MKKLYLCLSLILFFFCIGYKDALSKDSRSRPLKVNFAAARATLIHNGSSTLYGTIQSAINAAVDGDEVDVRAGTFTEQLTITQGITLKGAGLSQTIIQSPSASGLVQSGGNWKNLKAQDVFAVIGVKSPNAAVTISDLTVDGNNQGYLPDATYPDKNAYAFDGIASLNTTTTINNVKVTQVRELYSDYSGSTLPPGYLPADQPSGMNHNEGIFAESATGAGAHTLTITNSTVTKYQKTGILAWGPTLTVDIHDNTVQGYGQTLFSTGNGIQIASSDRTSLGGFNGDRTGTTGSVVNNQILGIGIVIPTQGNPGYYYNAGLGGSTGILLYNAGNGIQIKNNTITGSGTYSWHNSINSSNNDGYANQAIDITNSNNAVIQDNTMKDFDAGILEESSLSGSSLTVSGNTFSGNQIDVIGAAGDDQFSLGSGAEIIGYQKSNNGTDAITGFGTGDKLYLFDATASNVLNGMIGNSPSIDFTGGTISTGDGSNVAAHSVQVAVGPSSTTLYIDADGQAGAAEVQVKLNGTYSTGNFKLNKAYIEYATPAATLVHNNTQTDYSTIQSAINAAVNGDEVDVRAGTFTEQLTITQGITLKGAGLSQTIIQSPSASSLVQSGGNWKNLKAQDVFAVIGVKSPNAAVTISDLTVDGNNQGYLPDATYPDKNAYAFDGIASLNTTTTINNVKVTQVRELYSDYSGSTLPPGYLPADQPSGMNHNEGIFAESATGAGAHTLTITNSTVTKYQKTGILAWGPTLTVDIHDNTIQGYGQTLFSTGNGIQIASSDRTSLGGFNGDRTGTTGSVVNNQILGIGIVIPTQGNPGYYYNAGLGGSTGILLYNAGNGIQIKNNTITGSGTYSWHNSINSSNNDGYANQAIDITNSNNVVIQDNTMKDFDAGILEESSLSGSSLTVSGNTFSGNQIDVIGAAGDDQFSLGSGAEIIGYQKSNNGTDAITGFGTGDKLYLFDATARNVLNGMIGNNPSIDFTGGTISAGDGSNVVAHSVQVAVGPSSTTLYIDADGQAGAAEVQVKLNGTYATGNFKLNGAYIEYALATPVITFNALSAKIYGDADFDPGATSTNSGVPVTYTSSDTTVAAIVNGNIHIVGAGSATITASQVASGNYAAATNVQQTLTVNKKAIAVTADAKTKTYGDSDPVLTYTFSPALIQGDSFSGSFTRVAGENVGTYAINQGTLALSSNYTLTYTGANLKIGKKTIAVTADAKSKIYGQADPALTYTFSPALIQGDNFSGSLSRATGENVGTYAINQGSLSLSSNYALTYTGNSLTINPANRTLTFNNLPLKTYGDADFDGGASLSSNETVSYASADPSVATVVNGKIHIVGAGSTVITASAPNNANYNFTAPITQSFLVIKANQTISFSSIPTLTRGGKYDLSGVSSSSGLPVSFAVADKMIASLQGTQLTAQAIGTTRVTASAAGNSNYNDAIAVVQTVKVIDPNGLQVLVRRDVSPNGDGIGDGLYIEGIQDYPNNNVTVVNRDGVKVFEAKNYDNVNNIFNGRSNITNALQTPGTYFYIVQWTDAQGVGRRKAGYFVLKYNQ
ncbi:gliding motility-associated C-terminal domain-containing protein [Mucilaginibacter sp. RS28]|uniref:Gliding motility-associated C-terminal domain-containing protein n=1 Tax=Mucilaginibacter straminoryzae TaxID=2932774 RepID=A0A9X1X413_9SPHI|nr:MBG domain-containing protein [Mucilaginibacter straminoryzae]MCJ8210654.1 gliding motility-associated C-terminal domain-containing protein [Mucilaginibacter straminoryzae]